MALFGHKVDCDCCDKDVHREILLTEYEKKQLAQGMQCSVEMDRKISKVLMTCSPLRDITETDNVSNDA